MGVHQDSDTYYQIKSLLGIPPNEPIFIIRAQDKFSVKAIESYRNLVRDGIKIGDMKDWLHQVDSIISDVIDWQRDNKDKIKVPD